MVAAGKRVVRTRFWVDPEVCTGDHSCIRLSGCPSLTIKPNEDPLRTDPDRPRQQRLRRLRPVRRGRARGAALPLVRADRHHPEPDVAGIACGGRLSAALIRLLGGGRQRGRAALVPAE